MSQVSESHFQHDAVEALSQAIDSGSLYQVQQMIKTLPAASTVHLLESSPPETPSVPRKLIDKDDEGEIIQYLNEDLQNDILQQLPQKVTAQVLQAMDQQDRHRVETILSYNEDTAGGLMNTDTITVRRNHTVELVLRYLRRHESIPEMTDNLLVVSRADKFLSVLPLRAVLASDPNTSVREVVGEDIEAIPVDMEATQVAQLFEQHDWVSAPVIDCYGKLLGRIIIDRAVDVIRDSAELSLMSMAGLDEEDDTLAPVINSARRRALWLGVNLMTAVFASIVIYLFQDTIDQVFSLAVLMPIVAHMGGVAGTQKLTLVIHGLALGQLSPSNSRWLLARELGVAALNSTLWALVISWSRISGTGTCYSATLSPQQC